MLLSHSPHVKYPEAITIDGPVRIAWGTKDRILPFKGFSKGWKKVLPDAEWVKLENLGHVPMSDDPSLIAKTILEVTTATEATTSA
jgi:pimeloyl-ACP methyl ester carboxylesterase